MLREMFRRGGPQVEPGREVSLVLPSPQDFYLSAGQVSLDFTNTVSWRASRHPIEKLAKYDDLIAFCLQTRILGEPEAESFQRRAMERPEDASRAVSAARSFREALYRLLVAASASQPPAADDLSAVNSTLAMALERLRLSPALTGFQWAPSHDEEALEAPLWTLARSAADLLTSSNVALVRVCAGNHCGWLFMDTSRKQNRRWCTMGVCGNRAKARRFYEKEKLRKLTSTALGDSRAT